MKTVRITCLCLAVGIGSLRASDEFFDRMEQALTRSAAEDRVRARISGLLDFEGYFLSQPTPALVHANGTALFNPRLTAFVDAQLGSNIYVFAQARADRGFDPADEGLRARVDEYAIRFTPSHEGRFSLQLGKFATVVGTWVGRHASWSNPFITAPLAYENLTGMWDFEAVRFSGTLLQWSHVRAGLPPDVTAREKSLRIPIIWGPSYALGAALSGEVRRVQYAVEIKQASLSSRPEAWNHLDGWTYPTVSGRLGYRASAAWNLGVSASAGSYLRPFAANTVRRGFGRGDYRELVLGQDLSFAWHHLQIWTEIFAARFEIPVVGNADTLAYYVEARYKFTPQFSGALRWNEQLFASIPDRGRSTRWGQDAWRIDVAPTFRFTSHTQAKLQYSLQKALVGTRSYSQLTAIQLTVRF